MSRPEEIEEPLLMKAQVSELSDAPLACALLDQVVHGHSPERLLKVQYRILIVDLEGATGLLGTISDESFTQRHHIVVVGVGLVQFH